MAAVDAGILNLTGFESPDPQAHYFGQRALGMGLRDVYGRLIDGMQGALGQVRSGGDAGASLRMQAPPPTEDLAVAFSGPIRLDASGRAPLRFDFDGFNGTVRLMAVVWTAEGVGQASADVILRDPVVLAASLPRFLAPGDESLLRLELTHVAGDAGRVPLVVRADGPVDLDLSRLPSAVEVAEGGRDVIEVPVVARAVGDARITVDLTTPDGTAVQRVLTLGVRANDPEQRLTERLTLGPGATFTADRNLVADFVPGSGRVILSTGPLSRFDAAGLLAMLDRYPYGCTEQIASGVLPLLYAGGLARAMGLQTEGGDTRRLQQGIDTILGRQTAAGGFDLWRGTPGDLWLDAYVTDLLTRARAQGLQVPDRAHDLALSNLRNQINYAADFTSGGEDIAHALHALARAGAATMGDLRYYADVKGNAFSTALAQAQLGAALAFDGDQPRADRLFAAASARVLGQGPEPVVWRADYGTDRRDAAAVLALALEAGSAVIDRDGLIAASLATPDRPHSTQEAAWSILAAQALAEDPASGLIVNGQPSDGPLVRVLEAASFPTLEIQTAADRTETLVVTRFGVPRVAPPAGGNGYAIDRLYFTMDGEPIQPQQVAAGTRLVTVLKVTPLGTREGRLMVVDPLPAGFEIDNPALLAGGDVAALDWLQLEGAVQSVEFRSDRFLAAVDQRGTGAIQLAYVVRAVTPGQFHHPAAHVEDMYRPQFRAVGNTGRLVVTR